MLSGNTEEEKEHLKWINIQKSKKLKPWNFLSSCYLFFIYVIETVLFCPAARMKTLVANLWSLSLSLHPEEPTWQANLSLALIKKQKGVE